MAEASPFEAPQLFSFIFIGEVSLTSPLTTITYQPTSSPQMGSWTAVGAATGWQAVSSGTNTEFVELLPGTCRLPSQQIFFGFPTPSLPAGAQVYSVGVRRTIQCVVPPPTPLCYHWFISYSGTVSVSGQSLTPSTVFFSSTNPTNSQTGVFVTETIYTSTAAPDGTAWNPATNLASGNFFYAMGRGSVPNDNATLEVSEVYLDVTYQQLSSVTVTGPTGTSPATQPTITWNYVSADSQPQQGFRVAVYTLAQTLAGGFTPFTTTPIDGTSGFVLGEDQQWTMSIDLTNGQYAAYVQVESQWAGPGSFLSSIGSTTWTRSASSPPSNAVFNSAVFDAENNRVALTFTPGGASPATAAFTVFASRDGGQSYNPIPSLSYVSASGMSPVTVYDYVAPLNTTSQYFVLAYGGSPLAAAAGASSVLTATPVGDRAWLKDPSNPILNTILPIASPKQSEDGISITKRRMQGAFQLLGGPGTQQLPVIVSGPTYGDEYALELIFVQDDPSVPMSLFAAVDELDRSGNTLLLQLPDGTQLWVVTGPGASSQDTQEKYNAIPGDPTTTYWRRRKLTMTQVDAPAFY